MSAGRSERYGFAIFPGERWNSFEIASEWIARTTNSISKVGTILRNAGIFSMSSLGQPKVNKGKIFLPILKLMKRPQTKFHAHTISE